jgi:quinol monooxygenase YgiN
MRSEFHVYVQLSAPEGKAQELLVALERLSEASLATEFCSRFEVLQSSTNPAAFHLFESFSSKDDYPKHVSTSHAQHFLNFVISNLVAQRTVIYLENTNFTS